MQFGILGDKDAGEQLFKNGQSRGFDFYSMHLFLRRPGIVRSLAIGDFTVNMGQGLIHWQSLSFRKSSEVTASKRQAAVLRPYTSSGEHNFHRGVGISLGKDQWRLSAFGSFRKLSANLSLDPLSGTPVIASFITSGLHRTASELAERNNILQRAAGASISYEHTAWHVGGNLIHYEFSYPFQKRDEPYNLFSWKGRRLINYSIDYDYTWRNIHLFGEVAAGRQLDPGMVHGLLASLHRNASVSVVMRRLPPGFQSLYAGAFTENTLPSNESGLFLGLSVRPGRGFTLDTYADVFRFPWLRFRADAPSSGREYLLRLTYQPHKRLEISTRFRFESKQTNEPDNVAPLNMIRFVPKSSWRTHIAWHPSPELRLLQRIELVWFDKKGIGSEHGYLIYNDIAYNPSKKLYGISG